MPRADARRNYEALLVAARRAFAEHGVTASLDQIARTAGVGPGTLYRHFPSRDRLVLELIRESLEGLTALAPTLAAASSPADALAAWLDAYAAHAARFRGLAATLVTTDLDPDDPSLVACHDAQAAGRALVEAAVDSGDVDPATDPQDVLDLAAAVAWIIEQGPRGDDQRQRLLAVTVRGIGAEG
jgi:AcrR family transcriptional regulator